MKFHKFYPKNDYFDRMDGSDIFFSFTFTGSHFQTLQEENCVLASNIEQLTIRLEAQHKIKLLQEQTIGNKVFL